MKKISLTKRMLGKLVIPAFAFIALTIGSCNKKENMGIPAPTANSASETKSKQISSAVAKVLQNFASAKGGASRDFSNPALSYTTYSTPNATVYKWSDPTTGTTFTLSESSGGSGLGQLSYNGKSFDYNYVLAIKATAGDATWSGFMNGRDLRGVVAIDGELMDKDFSIKNLSIFLVATKGGSGTYKFIDWKSGVADGDGIGELLDFSDVKTPTLKSMNDAKYYVTSKGSVIVSENSFEMGGDAKVTDVKTNVAYSINGTIMFE